MSLIRRARILAVAAVAALAGLGVFVSASAGTASRSTSDLQRQFSAAVKVAQTRTAGTYVYVRSGQRTLSAHSFAISSVKCPRSHPLPISGLYASNSPNVFSSFSAPLKRKWITSLSNQGSSKAHVLIGAVCAR